MASAFTIRAGLPFVDALAAGLLEEAAGEALALADMLVLLPTRRACRALREAFLRRSEAPALLLPRIQPIGDVDEDELLTLGALDLELPPAIAPLRRRMLLARLVAHARKVPLDQALRLAAELARLLDDLQTHRVPLERLEQLVPEAYAEHWQRTLDFLHILRDAWPQVLDAEGALDPAARRDRLLGALADAWRTDPPARRIVAAGSTGSIPATRDLLKIVARLPRGAVVLPGLDRAIDSASWASLEPSHPQWGLRVLLEALGVDRADVADWPAPGIEGTPAARAALVSEVMRPAATTDEWQRLAPPPEEALSGLSLATAPDPAGEALALALRLRAALEIPGRTAALVTPDRQLARRVAVELERFGIEVDDSAGTPLDQNPAGSFLLLTAHLVVSGAAPVPLLSALKHPLAGGSERAEFRRRVRHLELAVLRGPRVTGGLEGLCRALGEGVAAPPELRSWLETIRQAAAPFTALCAGREAALSELVRTHVAFAEALAGPRELWAREAGEAAAALIAELLDAAADAEPLAPAAYPALLAELMAERPVRPREPRHPRVHILGQLEARLQHFDLVVLAGLNEGTWPRDPEPGPWLSRPMRLGLGLPPTEQAVGLAAHDFAELACAPEVVLSRAEKGADGKPAVPSRWLVRLDAVLGARAGLRRPAADPAWLAWARGLDAPEAYERPEPPSPRPPVRARPRDLPVTDIELWMRDPYALYAKRILGLRPLDDLDQDPSYPERGQIIHRALERFVRKYPDRLPNDPLDRLIEIGADVFSAYDHRPQVKALWWPRFRRIAEWFVDKEREREHAGRRALAELSGHMEIGAPAGAFHLRARADRIAIGPALQIVDYKTGSAPSGPQIDAFIAPQLPLEGVIAAAGGFEGVPPGPVEALEFWELKGGDPPARVVSAVGRRGQATATVEQAIALARARLIELVARFDDPHMPYLARPRPAFVPYGTDYDHLERVQEWATGESP